MLPRGTATAIMANQKANTLVGVICAAERHCDLLHHHKKPLPINVGVICAAERHCDPVKEVLRLVPRQGLLDDGTGLRPAYLKQDLSRLSVAKSRFFSVVGPLGRHGT